VRIIIEADVFSGERSTEDHGALLSLFHIGLDGHHTVEIDPEDSSTFARWVDAREGETREMCKRARARGIKQRARKRRRQEIRVAKIQAPSWNDRRLPPMVALGVVRRPLVLLLENARNDRKFLGVLTRLRRDFDFERLVREGLVDPQTNGGIGENRKWLEEHGHRPELALRYWLMCDSDARRGWERPMDGSIPKGIGDAEELAECCREHGVRLHILERRAIENYLPLPAIERWSAAGSDRAERYRALARLTPEQRHYYNMKRGFAQDVLNHKQAGREGDLYGGLDPQVKQTLDRGIGSDIADLFQEKDGFRILERWLVNDGQEDEAREIVDAIMELI
jgi:hypothetical protein